MKKSDFALKKARRRTVKDTSLLKKFKSDDRDGSKDTMQIITEKLITEANSAWHGAELLYIINTQRRGKRVARQDAGTSEKAQSKSSGSQYDRYIAMLRKKDSTQSISIIRLVLKEDEIEIKNTFDLSVLRAIDFGSDDNELLLSFDNADHNLYFASQNERDETLWIIIQVCKHIVRNDITVGYSIDIDALTYITSTNGTLSRFPLLQKMVQLHTKELGDYFSKEETEAETLLDELNWGSSLQEQTNLHSILSGQSEKLSNEIIDFLLQWEEMDLNTKNKGGATPGKGTGAKLPGVSDTSEVLQALGQVDQELEAVDMWLGEQIGRLEEVQANLHMIEDESGALESSWQSLRSVQEVVTMLVTRYSLDAKLEDTLLHPEKVMNPILKSPTLAKLEAGIEPLLEAMTTVRNALKLKFTDIADISGPQWKQLQNMTSISSQKAKLLDVVDSCCDAFTDTALGLFDWLVKHKALQEAGGVVKQFVFTEVMTEDVKNKPGKIYFTTLPQWFTKAKSPNHNQLMKAKLVYEANLQPFIPLLNLFTELSPKNQQPVQDAYLKAVTEGLYKPIFKTLAKDLMALCTVKHVVITLANVGRYRTKDRVPIVPVTFLKATPVGGNPSQNAALSLWMAFRVALMVVIPVLEQEENFVDTFFNMSGQVKFVGTTTGLDRHQAMMASIFDHIVQKFEVAISVRSSLPVGGSGGAATAAPAAAAPGAISGADGVAAVAMLAVLTDYEAALREAMIIQFSNNVTGDGRSRDNSEARSRASTAASPETKRAGRLSVSSPDTTAGTSGTTDTTSQVRSDEDALALYQDLYLSRSLESTRSALLNRVGAYAADQINWLKAQKADAKLADVLQPFASFPTLVAQIQEMCNGKHFDCVDDMLMKLCKELFHWLNQVANQNEKYSDKVKITNLGYFILVIPPLQVEVLDSFVQNATQQRAEAMVRYVNWMVQYEFPSLSALAVRLDGVGKKVNEEELSLYIRRKDVLNVVKELELKTLEGMVSTMRKRLIKHFRSDFDLEMRLVDRTWQQLKDRVVSILGRLEEAASLSYQIKLEVGPQVLGGIFDKVAGLVNNSADLSDKSTF